MTRLSVYVIVNDEVPKNTSFLAPSHYFSYIYRKPLKMEINHEIIKDAIFLADPTVSRKNIIFENVYVYDNIIMATYRELIWSNKFQISVEEYENRLKQKLRESNLKQIGI